MSTSIDERVVSMRFDNKQFEQNAAKTMSTLEKFKNALNLDGAAKGFAAIESAAAKITLHPLSKAADTVSVSFSAMSVASITAINNIVNGAVNAGKQLVRSLTIAPISQGFEEYELKMGSVQTIMASTGESLEVVNDYLDELNRYSDRTIYSFSDMTNNIGKFTNAGVKLKDAVSAIQGVSNVAAVSGANANEASRAMYNFAQALSAGYVKLIDWKSIENANMATVEFKTQLLDTAVAVGTLTKTTDGFYQTTSGHIFNATRDFNEYLKDQWLSNDVLIKTLGNYANEQTAIGKKAFAAAQDVKTLTQMIDTLKEAVGSGWAETWQLLFGDFNEAKKLWTGINNVISGIIDAQSRARNDMLKEWKDLGGRHVVINTFALAWQRLGAIIEPVRKAIADLFPPLTGRKLYELTVSIELFVNKLKLSDEALYTLYVLVKALTVPFRILWELFKAGVSIFAHAIVITVRLTDAFLSMLALTNPLAKFFEKVLGSSRYTKIAKSTEKIITRITNALLNLQKGTSDLIKQIRNSEPVINVLNGIQSALTGISNFVLDSIVSGFDAIANFDFSKVTDVASRGLNKLISIVNAFKQMISPVTDQVKIFFNQFEGKGLSESFKILIENIKSLGITVKDFIVNFDFEEALAKMRESGNGLLPVLAALVDQMVAFINTLTPGKILTFAFGASLTAVLLTITKLLNSASGLFGSFQGIMEAFQERIRPSKLQQIAQAIEIIAFSLLVLALVDVSKLKQATESMVAIMVGLTVMTGAIAAIDNKLINNAQLAKNFRHIGTGLMAIGAAVVELSAALMVLTHIDLQGIWTRLGILATMMLSLAGVAILMAKGAPVLTKGTLSLIFFTFAINQMVKTLLLLSGQDLSGVSANISGILGIITSLTLIALAAKGIKMGDAIGVIGLIAAIRLFINTINNLEEINMDGIGAKIVILLEVVGLITMLCFALQFAGEYSVRAGVSILAMSAAMMLVRFAIEQIGNLDPAVAEQGTKAVVALFGCFAAITALSYFSGPHSVKAASGIAVMSGALLVLGKAVDYLGNLDENAVIQGTKLVSWFMLLFGGLIAVGGLAKNGAPAISAMVAGVGLLMAAIVVMTVMDDLGDAIKAAQAISIAMVSLGAAIGLVSDINWKSAGKSALLMAAFLAEIVTAFHFMTDIKMSWKTILSVSAGLSMVIAAMSVSTRLLSKEIDFDSAVAAAVSMGALGIELGVAFGIMSLMGVDNAIELAEGLSIALVALSGVTVFLAKWKPELDDALKGLKTLGVVTLAIGVAVTIIGGLIKIFHAENIASEGADFIVSLAWLTPAIVALSVASAAIGFLGLASDKLNKYVSSEYGATLSGLGSLGVVFIAIAGVVGGIGWIIGSKDWQTFTSNATGFINQIGMLYPLLLNFSALTAILTALGAVGGGQSVIGFAAAGAAAFDVVFALIAALVGVIGWICSSDKVKQIIQNGSETCAKLGQAIGDFFGNLIRPILSAGSDNLSDTSTNLSDFMTDIQPFLEGASKIDQTTIDGVSALSTMVGDLIAIQWQSLFSIDTANLASFGEDLKAFAPDLADFADKVSGITPDQLLGVANAAKALSELAEGLPNYNLMDKIDGKMSLKTFGSQLKDFGPNFADFAGSISNVTTDTAQNAKTLAEALSTIVGAIPVTGKMFEGFEGVQDMGKFGEDLTLLGDGLTGFSNAIADYNSTIVDYRLPSIQSVFDTLASVPVVGFWKQVLAESDLSLFSSNILEFADGMKYFSDKIAYYHPEIVDDKLSSIESLLTTLEGIPGTGGLLGLILGGTKDLGAFSEDLSSFADALYKYWDKARLITKLPFDTSLPIVESLFETFGKIEPEKGFLAKLFGGDKDIEKFGTGLESVGTGLSAYYTAIKDADLERLSESISALSSLTSMLVLMNDSDFSESGVRFNNAVRGLSISAINDFISDFDTADEDVLNAVVGLIDKVNDGIGEHLSGVEVEGASLISAFIRGINAKQISVKISGEVLTSVLVSAIRAKQQDMSSAGKYLVEGLIDGVSSKSTDLTNAMNSLADTAIKETEKKFEVQSPSKVFFRIGGYVAQGLSNGVIDRSSEVNKTFELFANGLVDSSKDAFGIKGNKDSEEFTQIASYLVSGIQNGVKEYSPYANKAMENFSQCLLDTTKDFFQINSPSITMKDEVGKYLIQGIAEGITTDTSAEEAAEKKAQNIVSAFQNAISKFSLNMTTADLEYQLWSAVDAESATDSDNLSKQTDMITEKLKNQAEIVRLADAEYQATLQTMGKDATETQEAYNTYLQEQINMAQLAKELSEYRQNAATSQDNAMQTYKQLLKDETDFFVQSGFTMDEIDAWAKRQSGYDPENIVNSTIAVKDIIKEFMGDAAVEVEIAAEEIMAASVSKATSRGISSGVSLSLPEAYNSGEEIMQQLTEGVADGEDYLGDTIQETANGALWKAMSGDYSGSAMALLDGLSNKLIENAPVFGNALKRIGSWGLIVFDKFFDINSPSKVMEERGIYLMLGLLMGLEESKSEIANSITEFASNFLAEFDSVYDSSYELGKNFATSLGEGILSAISEKTPTAISATVEKTVLAFGNETQRFYTVGAVLGLQVMNGIVVGVEEGRSEAINAIVNVAVAAYQAACSALGINSPSRAFAEIGNYIDLGLAKGIVDGISHVTSSTGQLSDATVDAMSYAIRRISEIIEDEDFTEPVIRPVVDLSEVRSGFGKINTMMTSDRAVKVQGIIAKGKSIRDSQNGGQTGSETNNYNFTQNNYSPKALSRLEIYRQTRNQFAQFKGRTGK